MLERWGHDVRVAGDAPAPAEVLTFRRPDVVLLELVLPDGEGVTLQSRGCAPATSRRR